MQTNGSKGRMLAEINVTPFVDVMLVLLIIFMVTAPMMTQGIDVNLPQTEGPAIPTEDERLVVTVAQDRKIYINENEVDEGSLGAKLAALTHNLQATNQGVFLRADENVPYGVVVGVMATIRQAGISQIGMVTEPLNGSGRKAAQ
ncbi:MAG: protein TolR [Syntrophobacteraceae bacterium]